jgi:hypothetical protein
MKNTFLLLKLSYRQRTSPASIWPADPLPSIPPADKMIANSSTFYLN